MSTAITAKAGKCDHAAPDYLSEQPFGLLVPTSHPVAIHAVGIGPKQIRRGSRVYHLRGKTLERQNLRMAVVGGHHTSRFMPGTGAIDLIGLARTIAVGILSVGGDYQPSVPIAGKYRDSSL